MLRLLLFVLPLGLDSFAVAAAIGAAGPLSRRERWRISALFVVFEAGMPLVGLAVGAPLARLIGASADYVAAAALIGVGGWLLVHDDDDDSKAGQLVAARGTALIGLGLAISIDELAVGFGLGLAGLPVLPVVVAIAVQALLAVQLGLRLGSRIGDRFREAAERIAGAALVVLGVVVLVERLTA